MLIGHAAPLLARLRPAYEGRAVLVTGGASFIGSHLCELLAEAGGRVRVADDLSSGRLENLAEVRDRVEFLRGDLRDPAFAARASEGSEFVFHLAAQHGGRGYIDTHPVQCVGNMALDHAVFAAAADAGAKKIVFASSACVYPTNLQADDGNRGLLAESMADFDHPGHAFADGEYGWAKLMGELQLRAFHKQHGIDGVACRIFTAYGERENESHAVVALIAKALARMDPYPVWGNGLQTRNFTYVADTVMGMALAGATLKGFQAINVGTDRHHAILELVHEIFRFLAWEPRRIEHQLDKPVGVRSRAADVARCKDLLGWAPHWPLAEGVARTAGWYAQQLDRRRLGELDKLLMERA
jgi:UDP-glucose 4-epimerase